MSNERKGVSPPLRKVVLWERKRGRQLWKLIGRIERSGGGPLAMGYFLTGGIRGLVVPKGRGDGLVQGRKKNRSREGKGRLLSWKKHRTL